jgi:DNA-directed RNA polymerase subunit RPC12/RpoP
MLIGAELAFGAKPSAEVKAAGTRRGISQATMKRAAQELDVVIEQRTTPTGRVTFWALPEGVGSVPNTHGEPIPSDRMVKPNPGGSAHEGVLGADPTPQDPTCVVCKAPFAPGRDGATQFRCPDCVRHGCATCDRPFDPEQEGASALRCPDCVRRGSSRRDD